MTPFYADDWLTVYAGDTRAVLRDLESESVDCIITSPPYWQQRNYLPDDHPDKALELGRELTFDQWLRNIVGIAGQLQRILKPTGSLWLNLGDRYCANGGPTGSRRHRWNEARGQVSDTRTSRHGFPAGVQRKSLLLAPYRVAIELCEQGWILRDKIVWAKTNGVPESVQDRFHVRDEVFFRFTLEQRAYFDVGAVREPYAEASIQRARPHRALTFATVKSRPPGQRPRSPRGPNKAPWTGRGDVDAHRDAFHRQGAIRGDGKNPGNVWRIATASGGRGSQFDHFAMFPNELVRRPILATCPPGGIVLDPFAGTGTVAEVANAHMRRAILIELDPASLEAIRRRTEKRPIVAVPA